jgi:hypothetical protein
MSDTDTRLPAAYRVELTHTPADDPWPWAAHVYAPPESDEPDYSLVKVCQGSSRAEVFERARDWIVAAQAATTPREVLYLDERGDLAAAPDVGLYSVKV